jgi:hypothetical protein
LASSAQALAKHAAAASDHLASLANSHAPTTIRRRLSALGKMHRFNDLAWNSMEACRGAASMTT